MSFCKQITDDAFIHLKNIKDLNISYTNITGNGFVHFKRNPMIYIQ